MRFLIPLLALLFVTSAGPVLALDGCYVPHGASYNIDEQGTCSSVTNNHASGSEIFVPTKTAAEWSTGSTAFLNALPAGVTAAACNSPCGAVVSCAPGGGGGGSSGNRYLLSSETAVPAPSGPCEDTWSKVSSRGRHVCAIRASDDTLWCWGENGSGQLGTGDSLYKNEPAQVSGGGAWTMVAAGYSHTCGIKTNGSLWCWGAGGSGQLGQGANASSTTPVQVSGGGTWQWVTTASGTHGSYTGSNFSCGVKTDGTGWCWGYSWHGELGYGGAGTSANKNVPTAISGGGTWTKIVAGRVAVCGLKSDGTGYCWGDHGWDSGEQHTPGSKGTGFTDIETNSDLQCGLKGTTAYCWNLTSWGGSSARAIPGSWTKLAVADNSTLYATDSSNNLYYIASSGTATLIPAVSVPIFSGGNIGLSFLGTQTSPKSCVAPYGFAVGVASGSSITAYQDGGSCSGGCTSETRTCNDGVLSGSYTFRKCTPGVSVGGYCWYNTEDDDESCDYICGVHGGCNLTGTLNYVGSAGTNAHCQAVMQALGYTATTYSSSTGTAGAGCYSSTSTNYRRNTSAATSCDVEEEDRACACNQ